MKFILAIIGAVSAIHLSHHDEPPVQPPHIGVFCTWDPVNGLQTTGECTNSNVACASLSKEREDNQKAEDTGSNARRSCALNGIRKE